MKAVSVVFALVLLASALAGCAAQQPKPMTGAFVGYEMRGTGAYQVPVNPPDDGGFHAHEVREPTGNAYVKLSDGTRVTARCPISGLSTGSAVVVQKNAGDPQEDTEDTWVVLGKR